MNIRKTIIVVSAVALTVPAWAISLGGAQGNVILGSSADLIFDVIPNAGQDLESSCVKATATAGDTPVSASAVRVTPMPAVAGRPGRVKVQIAQAIEEPVLSIKLTAGCTGGTVSRTYSFLADLPQQAAASPRPVDIRSIGSNASANSVSNRSRSSTADSKLAQLPSARVSPPARPGPTSTKSENKSTDPADTRSKPAVLAEPKRPRGVAAKPAERRARLIVEPLDLWLDSPITLRVSSGLMTTPSTEQTPERAKAADLWRALNTPVESLTDSLNQAEALTGEVAALRQKSDRDSKAAAEFQRRAQMAESERYPAGVVYGLSALLLLSLGGAFWLWRHRQPVARKALLQTGLSAGNRLRKEPSERSSTLQTPSVFGPQSDFGPSTFGGIQAPESKPNNSRNASRDPAIVTSPAALSVTPEDVSSVDQNDIAPVDSSIGEQRAIPPEELFDIQQQADFFVSVGEHQQAIDVLKNHIQSHAKASPLAYLELLRLYHTLSRPTEFSGLRTEFMAQFNAFVPEFSRFTRPGRSLERYNDALAEIEAEWTSGTVVHLLEALLFREAGDPSGVPFDLSAFDDLLLLWSIARTTSPDERGAVGASRVRTTPDAASGFEQAAAFAVSGMSLPPELADSRPSSPLNATLEQEFGLLLPRDPSPSRPMTLEAPSPSKVHRGLDLDLSDLGPELEMPHITISDLPAVPVTPPPPEGKPVGFDVPHDEEQALRLELQRLDDELPKDKQ